MLVFLLTALSGIIASVVMFSVHSLFYRLGWIRVNPNDAFDPFLRDFFRWIPFPAMVTKILIGAVFAYFYMALAWMIVPQTPLAIITMCTVLGFVHGYGVSNIDAILVSEAHPVRTFRRNSWQIHATHISSHIIYGFVLGICFVMFVPALHP